MLKNILYYLIKNINNFIPKSKIFIFSSIPDYSDNALAVFQYMYKYYPHYKYVWLVKNDDNIEKYANVEYIKRHSLKGLFCFFKAKYIFHTHGIYLNATSKKQNVFSLWHGMPLKKIQYLFPKDLLNIADRNLNFDLTVATSDLMGNVVASCFNCENDKVKIVGLPRNDFLYECIPFKNIQSKKIIAWMPTYRDGNHRTEGKQYEYGIPLINNLNLKEVNQFCDDLNVMLLIKLHPFQKYDNKLPVLSNMQLVDKHIENNKHFYHYLGVTDALITDYSSVYIDYLQLDKPIGFILDDYEEYDDDRGFVFKDPIKYMPGNHIYTLEDFKQFIYEIAHGIDTNKNLRDTVGRDLNKFRDNKNTERLMKEVFKIIKGEI